MATVRKRTWDTPGGPKTAWVADYADQSGKRRLRTFRTRKAADEFLVGARHEIRQGVHTPSSQSITVADAGELWVMQGENDGLERATLLNYRGHLRFHIVPLIGTVKLADLSPGMVQTFRNDLLKTGRSRVMVRKVMTSLGSILGNAMAAGKIARNVVREQTSSARRQGRLSACWTRRALNW